VSIETIRAKLIPFLAETTDFAEEQINSDSHLYEDLEMDSLSVLELTVFTEDEFGISVENEFKEAIGDPALRKDMTVDWLVSIIAKRANQSAN